MIANSLPGSAGRNGTPSPLGKSAGKAAHKNLPVVQKSVEMDQLRYFLVAARLEHFGRSAEALGISQPALSRSICKIEEVCGVKLFERAGRGICLNANGTIFLGHVERIFNELEDGRREMLERSKKGKESISIGFLATLGSAVIPSLIRGFRAKHADADFRLLQGPAPQLRQRLVKGEIDLCLSSPRFVDAALHWEPLYDEELFVLVPPRHRLASREEVDLIEIADESIVALQPGYGLRQVLDDAAREAGFTPKIAFETEEVSTVWGLVGAGFGVTLVPRRETDASGEDLPVSIPVRSPRCFRTIGLSWRGGRYLPAQTVGFQKHIIAALAKR